jgi:hypothetical protein
LLGLFTRVRFRVRYDVSRSKVGGMYGMYGRVGTIPPHILLVFKF